MHPQEDGGGDSKRRGERGAGEERDPPRAANIPGGSWQFTDEAFLNRASECFGCVPFGEPVFKGKGELAIGSVLPAARLAFGNVGVHALAKAP
jgi:hypothetical protein